MTVNDLVEQSVSDELGRLHVEMIKARAIIKAQGELVAKLKAEVAALKDQLSAAMEAANQPELPMVNVNGAAHH